MAAARTTTSDANNHRPLAAVSTAIIGARCQICLDDFSVHDDDHSDKASASTTMIIKFFCSASCPAVVCSGCLAEHVRISVAAAFPGVLPKVRCPVCLVCVNKSKWKAFASQQVLTKYKQICEYTCSFFATCCGAANYTQLPYAYNCEDLPDKYIQPAPLIAQIPLALTKELPSLRAHTKLFGNHKLSSQALISFIEETFGQRGHSAHGGELATQHLVVEHLLPRIMDEERRATLLLSYHYKYVEVETRCCGVSVCFNCKRLMRNHPPKWVAGDPCDGDGDGLDGSCILACRACHVTIVKVEGCDSVMCLCGHHMWWDAEIRRRDQEKSSDKTRKTL